MLFSHGRVMTIRPLHATILLSLPKRKMDHTKKPINSYLPRAHCAGPLLDKEVAAIHF